jgi:ribosomal protein S1
LAIKKISKSKTPTTMEELLAKRAPVIPSFSRGQKITATLVELTNKYAIFDVGGKGEGVLSDIYFQEARDYVRSLRVGEKVTATVIDPETSEGNVLLSLRHAASDSLWDNLDKARAEDRTISVTVRNVTNSGILVDIGSVQGFIPMSQLGRKVLTDLSNLTGKNLSVKVLDIDRERRKVVLSEKYVSEADQLDRLKKAIKKIKEGEIYSGKVTTATEFGLFVSVDVGKVPVEGLVHLSELSWEKVNTPTDIAKEGDKVNVKVIAIKDGKLALSIRQAVEDPWEHIDKKYKVDDKVRGKVVRISDFGAFVAVEPGIEGLIHITKIPPAQRLTVGSEVDCYIEDMDRENKKISLGLILTSKPVAYK